MKHITFELNGITYSTHFKVGFFRGIHDIEIFSGPTGTRLLPPVPAKIKSATPSLSKRVALWMRFEKIRFLNKCHYFDSKISKCTDERHIF